MSVKNASSDATFVSASSRYSALFSKSEFTTVSDDDSFDPSTIQTTRSRTWQNTPFKIEYALSTTEFPPLTPKVSATAPTTTTDDDTIQTAIAAAIAKSEAKTQAALQAATEKMDARIKEIEVSVSKVADQILASLQGPNTPFVTKVDHLQLRSDFSALSTKMDAMMDILINKPNGSTTETPSKKRQNTASSPPRPTAHAPSAPSSPDTQMEEEECELE